MRIGGRRAIIINFDTFHIKAPNRTNILRDKGNKKKELWDFFLISKNEYE